METFETLARTPAERGALARLRDATGAIEGPMERHCLRVRHLASELGRQRAWELDPEVLTVAAILHDIGLYPSVSSGGVYTAEGAELARELLREHGWRSDRVDLCAEAIDRHHELRRQLQRGAEVEALRLADLIDLSAGLLTCGLDRRWLRTLGDAVPRRGFGGELTRSVGRALASRPLTMAQIFLRPGRRP